MRSVFAGIALGACFLVVLPCAAQTGGAVYHFEEPGAVAVDASGAGNDGTISGATIVTGHEGNGLHFGAQLNDAVLVPQSVFSGFNGAGYFEAWIRPSDTNGCGGAGSILRKRTITGSGWEWGVWTGAAAGGVTCVLYSPNVVGLGVTSAPIPLGEWTKVGCEYDGAALRLFIDGAEVGHDDGALAVDWNASYLRTEIGNDTTDTGINCGDYGFHGDIDEVKFLPRKPHASGAVYSFNEGQGTVALDSSGAGNDGTVSGATWVPGRTGLPGDTALSFRPGGVNDNVLVPQSIYSGFGNTAYVEAWIKPATTPSGICPRHTIFRKRAHDNDWEMTLLDGGTLGCALADPGGNGAGGAWGHVSAGVWTKVACWYDGTAIRGFVNDVEVGNAPGAFIPDWGLNYFRTEIGNDTWDTGINCYDYGFDGQIDDVTISSVKSQSPPCIGEDEFSTPLSQDALWNAQLAEGGAGSVASASIPGAVDGALVLTYPGGNTHAGPGKGVSIASRDRRGYGTYSARLKPAPPAVDSEGNRAGVVSGFFTYYHPEGTNTNHEIDIEFVSSSPSVIWTTVWTTYDETTKAFTKQTRGIDISSGAIVQNTAPNSTSLESAGKLDKRYRIPGFKASERFATYGFDWSAGKVSFWMDLEDGSGRRTLATFEGTPGVDIPSLPGFVIANEWYTDAAFDGKKALEPPAAAVEFDVDRVSLPCPSF